MIKKLRKEQAKMLLKSKGSVSFSKVLNQYLKLGLKNGGADNFMAKKGILKLPNKVVPRIRISKLGGKFC